MSTLQVVLENFFTTIDIETDGGCSHLEEALAHEHAPALIHCACSFALAALACGGPWPQIAMDEMGALLQQFRNSVISTPVLQ